MTDPTSDIISEITAYESGEMDDEEIVAFFQRLIDSGTVDHLQGHYGRTAATLIADGLCRPPRRPGAS